MVKKAAAGFTLLETLVYMSLLSILLSGAFGVLYGIMESAKRYNLRTQIISEGNYVQSKLKYLFYSAASVSVSYSAITFHPLNNPAQVVQVSLQNGHLVIQRGSSTPVSVTSDNIIVQNFIATSTPAQFFVNFKINSTDFMVTLPHL